MVTLIAWRNVWRSRLRSMVVIISVALGLMAGVFMIAFSYGLNQERTRNIIETRISHIQLHDKNFQDERKVRLMIPEGEKVLAKVEQDQRVKAATSRLVLTGMIQTSRGAYGVQIIGIDPDKEATVTQLKDRIIGGNYLDEGADNGMLIGGALMEKLGWVQEDSSGISYTLRRKKPTLAFQTPGGQTQNALFRLTGVFESANKKLDESTVYVSQEWLTQLLDTAYHGIRMHEIAILLQNPEVADDTLFLQQLRADNPTLAVENWKEIAPELKLMDESFGATVMIFIGIIMFALLFGIVNTMYMSVMERTRELGMLMSVGMNKTKVFIMIMLETFFLSMIGAPIGLLGALGLVTYFGHAGINISSFSEGASSMGVGNIVFTDLPSQYYGQIAIMVVVTALIAAIFPARKALKLNPSEAVRAI